MFLDITKVAECQWKNADVSKTHGKCDEIYIFFESLLGKAQLYQFHHSKIYVTDFRKELVFLPIPHPWAAPKRPIWMGLMSINEPINKLCNETWVKLNVLARISANMSTEMSKLIMKVFITSVISHYPFECFN